jgi:hypothetical protein
MKMENRTEKNEGPWGFEQESIFRWGSTKRKSLQFDYFFVPTLHIHYEKKMLARWKDKKQ